MTQKVISEYDNHKLIYHPHQISKWLNNETFYPVYAEIAPTSACNYRCIFCAFDYVQRNIKTLDNKLYYSLIDEFKELGIKAIMFAGEGEPMLHKSIDKFCEYSYKNEIDVSITTNGSNLHKVQYANLLPYLSWLRISLNAASENTFEKIHQINSKVFHQVLENIKKATEFKKKNKLKVTIGIQFLLIEENDHEIIEIAKIGKKLGVDYLSIKPYSQHPKSINRLSTNYGKYSSLKDKILSDADENYQIIYREEAMDSLIQKKIYGKCHGLDFFSLIDADGNVIPCNLFYTGNDKYSYGNIKEKAFKEIWNGEKRKLINSEINKNLCTNCRLGCRLSSINNYLHRLLNPLKHDNFI